MDHKRSKKLSVQPPKELLKVMGRIMDKSALDLVRQGLLDPMLPADERRLKAIELFLKSRAKGVWVIDHTSTILRYGHYFKQKNKQELAILLYATACEHKINSFIRDFADNAGFDESEIPQIIRDTSFNAKCTWLFKLLKAPQLGRIHVKRLRQLMDLRNEFVHYKWKFEPIDHTKEDTRHEELLKVLPLTFRYLSSYERKHIYRGAKRRLSKGTLTKSSLRSSL